MTVEELIEKLQELSPTALVFVDVGSGEEENILAVIGAVYEYGDVTLELE